MSRKSSVMAALFLGLLTTGVGCFTPPRPPIPEADLKAVTQGNNTFAIELYQKWASQTDADKNIGISPYSISSALAMTYIGARGDTATQMAKVLHFNPDQDAFHPMFAGFVDHLMKHDATSQRQLASANAIWVERTMPVQEPFQALMKNLYGTGTLRQVDFIHQGEAVRQEINGWVGERTQKMIPEVLPTGSLDASTRMALVNAFYFRDFWKHQFSPEATQSADFHISPNKSVKVSMMFQENVFRYASGNNYEMVELPYVGDRFTMTIVLPKAHDQLEAVEKALPELNEWMARLRLRELRLFVPRFTLEGQTTLSDTLSAMGLPMDGDYSGITPGVSISEIHHAAKIKVDEEGTTAAAATAVQAKSEGPPPTAPTIRCDHPFLVILRDTSSGSILFMGRVTQPETSDVK